MNTKTFLILCVAAFIASSCKQATKNNAAKILPTTDTVLAEHFIDNENNVIESNINWDSLYYESMARDLKNFKLYHVVDTIVQDLNGDGIAEKIFFNGYQKIIIVDGATKSEIEFDNGINNVFDWVNLWGVTTDNETYRMVIPDEGISDTVPLHFPSIFVRQYEYGGGIITFDNEKYVWTHQSD